MSIEICWFKLNWEIVENIVVFKESIFHLIICQQNGFVLADIEKKMQLTLEGDINCDLKLKSLQLLLVIVHCSLVHCSNS